MSQSQYRNELALQIAAHRLAQGTHDSKNWATKKHTISGTDHIVAAGDLAALVGNRTIARRAKQYAKYADDVREIHRLSKIRSHAPMVTAIQEGKTNAVRNMLSTTHVLGNASQYPYPIDATIPRTALHHAVGSSKPEITKMLLQYGVDVNARDTTRKTPLHEAAQYGHKIKVNHMRVLLEHGARVDARTIFGKTPLHVAARDGGLAHVTLLLKNGADVNAIDDNGYTPLHLAVIGGNVGIVKILLRYGANPHIRNPRFTALDIAKHMLRKWETTNFQNASDNVFGYRAEGVKREARKKIVNILEKAMG